MRPILLTTATLALTTAVLASWATPAFAGCTPPAGLERLVADWAAKRPSGRLGLSDMDEALCMREGLVRKLGEHQGRMVGYKAGLTNKAVQARFGTDAPVAGILLEGMILEDGAKVPAAYGARPVWEADLLLVVKDGGINTAKTSEDVLEHISGFRPFIELADLVFGPDEKLDGLQITAINVGARLGVAGRETPLDASAETVKALADMKVVARDAGGAVLAEGTGAATLGNPLAVVLWLIEDLARSGRRLQAGDLISVGAFTPLTPPKPGQTVTVGYAGLPGNPTVSVTFE